MLRNTFVHIPGIGAKTEARLWKAGITSWDAFVRSCQDGLSLARKAFIRKYLDESEQYLAQENTRYFARCLTSRFHWRLFPHFRHLTAYLDIETTGMSASYEDITVIGLYDGDAIFYYVKDQNLDDFREDIDKYQVVVTYNGKCFDIPFIREAMGLAMDQAHIDLRFVLASLGFSGGLKGCERQAGISRGEVAGLDGYDAVLLWNLFRATEDQRVLETLLAYNLQDVVNLETLMVMAYNLKLRETPFQVSHQLPLPALPEIPFRGHLDIVERIKMEQGRGLSDYL
jgi:uncharacterized protein YprB with RNaseH-like and TPR domain